MILCCCCCLLLLLLFVVVVVYLLLLFNFDVCCRVTVSVGGADRHQRSGSSYGECSGNQIGSGFELHLLLLCVCMCVFANYSLFLQCLDWQPVSLFRLKWAADMICNAEPERVAETVMRCCDVLIVSISVCPSLSLCFCFFSLMCKTLSGRLNLCLWSYQSLSLSLSLCLSLMPLTIHFSVKDRLKLDDRWWLR